MSHLANDGFSIVPPVKKAGIDGTTVADTTLFTTETGRLWVPERCLFRLATVSGFITVPTVSLGTNSTPFDNILAAALLTAVDAADEVLTFDIPFLTAKAAVPGGTAVKCRVSVAAVATTYTFDVHLLGRYLS